MQYMWVPKSELDRMEDRKRLKRKAIGIWAFFTIIAPLMEHRYIPRSVGHDLSQLPTRKAIFVEVFAICASSITFAIGVYLFYWRQRLRGSVPKVLVCQKCENVKSDDGNYQCVCGGKCVDIDSVKWVEHRKKITLTYNFIMSHSLCWPVICNNESLE